MKFTLSKYNSSKIFLIDASGAFISAVLLLLLHSFDEYFGMPKHILTIFIGIAILLFLYSTVIYLISPKSWKTYLKAIAILNMAYCAFTAYQVFQCFENLTVYGKLYFAGEILVIIFLSIYELKIATINTEFKI
ncbi:MAG: hypothetical protein ACK41Z_14280 [Sediminibacterium sp.]